MPGLILPEEGDWEPSGQLCLWQAPNCSLHLSIDNYEHQVASNVRIINYNASLA